MSFLLPRQGTAPAGQAGTSSGGGAAGNGGGAANAAPNSDYASLLDSFIWIMIITAALFSLFVLVVLPRHIARLLSGSKGGELFKGLRFGDKGYRDSPIRQYAVDLRPDRPVRPRHVPTLREVVPGLGVLSHEIPYTGRYTVGQLFCLAVYTGLVAVALGSEKWVNNTTPN